MTGSGDIAGGGTFMDLTIDASGTYTLTDAMTVSGDLVVSGGTLDANGETTTVTGLTTVSGGTYETSTGTQTLDGGLVISDTGTVTAGSGEIEVNGDFDQTGGTFTGSTGTLDVNGNLTINDGTFTAPSGTLELSGDFDHAGGTFDHNNGTVLLDGGDQAISGTTTFYDLTKIDGGGDTLTFEEGSTQSVEGILTLQGDESGVLTVESSGSDVVNWDLTNSDQADLEDLFVENIHNLNGELNVVGKNVTSSGDNEGWTFTLPVAPNNDAEIERGDALVDKTLSGLSENVPDFPKNSLYIDFWPMIQQYLESLRPILTAEASDSGANA